MAGVQQPLGQGAVIGHEQQTLRIQIQAAHRVDPCAGICHQLRNRGAALLIGQGGHIATGLVQHQIDQARSGVQRRPVPLRVGPLAQNCRTAIDGDPSGEDILL